MAENHADYTAPGLETEDTHRVTEILQTRLHALNDLQLTLKHAHWNVVGPEFTSVHEMLDPQVDEVRGWADDAAERIATLGVSPKGTPGAIVTGRAWEDYSLNRASALSHITKLNRASALSHITELNNVYTDIIKDFRTAIAESGKVDPITEDILVELTRGLELFQWFLRAFITKSDGSLDPVTE